MKICRLLCLAIMSFFLMGATSEAQPFFGMPSFTEPKPTRENCYIYYFRVNDSESPLNIRSTPEVMQDNIIGTLPNRSMGTILSEKDGWFQISVPGSNAPQETGWISASRTEYGCNRFSEPITTTPYRIPASRIVGTGSHDYELQLKAGQTLVIRPDPPENAKEFRDWPTSVAGPGIPGRAEGLPNPYTLWWRKQGDQTTPEPPEWRWNVTKGGRYTISYGSSFKGFSYGSSIVIAEGNGNDWR